MKKRIIGAIAIACAVIWCIRYYTLNGTFAVHGIYQEEVYTMYDVVEFDDCMSYGGYEAYVNSGKKYDDFVVFRCIEYDSLEFRHFIVILPSHTTDYMYKLLRY